MKTTKHSRIAYVLLRVTMGFNLLGHGLARIPKIAGFRDWMTTTFEPTMLPNWTVYAWASILPYIEFTVGMLLVLGLFTCRAVVVGGAVMAVLVLGSCLAEKWEWAGMQMIYGLFFYFLIGKVDDNTFSLDTLITKKSKK